MDRATSMGIAISPSAILKRSLKSAFVMGVVALVPSLVSAASQGTTEQAGYEWAKKMGIVDPGRCKGPTDEFAQGCRNWAIQQALNVDTKTNILPPSGISTGPNFYGNSAYSPPRYNSSQIPVFRRPWGE